MSKKISVFLSFLLFALSGLPAFAGFPDYLPSLIGGGGSGGNVTLLPDRTSNLGSTTSTTSATPSTTTIALPSNSSRLAWLIQSDPTNSGSIELLNGGVVFFILLPGAAYQNVYPERIITGDISVRSSMASQKYAGFQN